MKSIKTIFNEVYSGGFVDELMIMEAQLLFNLDNLEAYIQLDENEFFSEDMYTEEGNDLYE